VRGQEDWKVYAVLYSNIKYICCFLGFVTQTYKLKIFFGSSASERFPNSPKQTGLQDLDSFDLIRLIVDPSIICHSRAIINIV
jgi:hypothetical protein